MAKSKKKKGKGKSETKKTTPNQSTTINKLDNLAKGFEDKKILDKIEELKELEAKMKSDYDEEVKNFRDEHNKQKQALQDKLDTKDKRLDKEFKDKKEKLDKDYSAKKEKLQSDYTDKKDNVAALENEWQKKLDEIRNNSEALGNEYYEKEKQKADEDIDKMRNIAKSELEGFRTKEEVRLEKKEKDLIDEHNKFVEEDKATREKSFDDQRTELEKEWKNLKTAQEQFKENITAFNKDKMEHEIDVDDFKFTKQLVNDERTKLKEMQEKYSEAQVRALEHRINELEAINKADNDRLVVLRDEYMSLRNNLPTGELDAETLLQENANLKELSKKLSDEIEEYPSMKDLESLRNDRLKLNDIHEELSLTQEKLKREERIRTSLEIGVMQLEQSKKVAETLRGLNGHLQSELNDINQMFKQDTKKRFKALLDIDEELMKKESIVYPSNRHSLKDIVKYVRAYGAVEENLYYTEKMIRCCIASMASSKLLILQGLSGTGKSSLPRLLGKALKFDHSLISVEPSWRDRRELLGYDNDFSKQFKETEFTKYLYNASAPINKDTVHIVVLDEVNLARIEYFFTDFLSVLEKPANEWEIPLISSNHEENEDLVPKFLVEKTKLKVHENVWFFGTANRDESTFAITNKVYDRAQVLDFQERGEAFEESLKTKIRLSFSDFNNLILDANEEESYKLNADDLEKIESVDNYLKKNIDITFGNRIRNQMNVFVPVFVACGGTKEEAIDYIFAHKVLRQLEDKYDNYLLKALEGLVEEIRLHYGIENFTESMSIIIKKIKRLGGNHESILIK